MVVVFIIFTGDEVDNEYLFIYLIQISLKVLVIYFIYLFQGPIGRQPWLYWSLNFLINCYL